MTPIVRWTVLGALFAIPFIPLYIANGLFFPFITGKHFAFRILVEVAVVGWGLLTLLDAKYRPRFSWTAAIYVGLVVWMFVADLLAVNPHKAFWSNYERMDGWITLVHVFLLFMVAGSMLSVENLWRKWWLTFVGASAFVCAYSFLQVMGVFAIHQGGVRLDATMGNAAYLAVYLLFVIAVSAWLAFESRGMLRYSLFALAGLQSLVLFMTATRGALLGFVGALVLGAILWMVGSGKRARRYGTSILIGLVLAGGVFFLIKDTDWVRSEPTLSRIASISLTDGSTRFTLWDMAWKGALERPVFGWGHEGFNYIFNANYQPSLYAQEPWFDRAHNMFIDWLVAGGFPAFFLFLALLGVGIRALWQHEKPAERIMLICAVAAYAFQGLFVFDNLFAYVPMAMILAMAHRATSRPIKQLEELPTISENTFQTIAVPVGAVLAIVLVWVVNVPSMQAGNDLIHGLSQWPDQRTNLAAFESAISRGSFANQEISEQWVTYAAGLDNSTAPNEVKSVLAKRAAEELGKQVAIAPNDARLRLEYAYAFRTQGDFARAKEEIAKAQALSPRKQSLIVEEGILLWQMNDFKGSRDAFKRAYDLDPSFDDLALYYAAGNIVAGDAAAGEKLMLERFGTTTSTNGVVILAYYETKDYAKLFPSLEQRLIESGGDPSVYYQLATAYAEAGRLEDARRTLRDALKLYPSLAPQITQMLTSLGASAQ